MLARISGWVVALAMLAGVAGAQDLSKKAYKDSVKAVDFSVHLFFEESGELSPDIFKLEEFGVWNFSAHWKGNNGGKFSGFLVRVKMQSRARGDVFAEGKQAQLVLRDRKTKKILRSWTISDVYVSDKGIGYRAQFFTGLDCNLMEVALIADGTRITRDLPFACGE